MHPKDAADLELGKGAEVWCESEHGRIKAVIEIDDSVRPGVLMLPHGYGARYKGLLPFGPEINQLTASGDCDPLARTPFHKYVPVRILKIEPESAPA